MPKSLLNGHFTLSIILQFFPGTSRIAISTAGVKNCVVSYFLYSDPVHLPDN
jgi:hypothetical protein